MALNATKPATPAAVADTTGPRAPRPALTPGGSDAQRLASASTVPPETDAAAGDEAGRIPAGTMISERYKIRRVLGEGGMGVVYSAEHVLMRKEVAVKVLHADMCSMPEVVARFEREAIAAAHIDHPNVAGATDFGRLDDGACFLVLELLKGTSLRDEIAKGPIAVGRSLRILRGIASGVSAAHAKGIVHRDLKPENVMLVDRDGDADFVKVLDFGIAKVDPATVAASGVGSHEAAGKVLTRVGTVFGTPEYMAPEQAVGDTVDARADLYALGVIFLEMLTGKCPFAGNALSILRERILAVGPPDMSAIEDEGCKALVARLLTRQPDDRMQSGAELVAAIDQLLEERRGGGATASVPPPPLGSAPSVNGTTNPVVTTNPALITGPVVSGAGAVGTTGWKKTWIVVPIGLAAALLITFGTFAVVKAVSAPRSLPTGSLSSAPPADTNTAPADTNVAPAPAASPSASSASVELDDDAPTPTPTATGSAASARAAPRARPNARPQQRKKKDTINIPNPFK